MYEDGCFTIRKDPGFLNDTVEQSPLVILTGVCVRGSNILYSVKALRFFVVVFLEPYPRHMEVLRVEVESEL